MISSMPRAWHRLRNIADFMAAPGSVISMNGTPWNGSCSPRFCMAQIRTWQMFSADSEPSTYWT
ncbi:hypothetical protein FQZ97_1213720 [compost metagenome]